MVLIYIFYLEEKDQTNPRVDVDAVRCQPVQQSSSKVGAVLWCCSVKQYCNHR